MLDVKWIRENVNKFDALMKSRGCDSVSSKIIQLDEEKRQLVTLIQKLQQARNEKAKLMAQMHNLSSPGVKELKKDASDIKDKLSKLELELADDKLNNFLSTLPNIPADDVPEGVSEKDNVEVKKVGIIKPKDFEAKQHFQIGEELGLMDFTDAAKISGSRFVILKKDLSRLHRALVNFMIDVHTSKFGFEEITPPVLVRDNAMYNVGQLPKFDEDSYKTNDSLRLIPTAEVPLVNLMEDKIITSENLPLRFVAYTECFRLEAGAAGKDTRGMLRQHQFSKVELVSFTTPDRSEQEHQHILSAAEEILKLLDIPYRVMLLCSGDMSFAAKKTYDLEVWLPGQSCYREISSCSNCGDFQARRLKARYREKNVKETIFMHSLNGSGLAIGRTIIAILENYQNQDGSVTIPEVLVPYMGGVTRIAPQK